MNHITLFHIEIAAVTSGVLGTIAALLMIFSRIKYTIKTKEHVDNIGDFGVAAENTKLTKLYIVATRFALIFYIIAIVLLITYSAVYSNAVKHGAYGDFYKSATLEEIKYNNDTGFIDQSEELPDGIKGSILIFFRWGCKDCSNIHDALIAELETRNPFKTYFVSSRSERGVELIEKYPISSVPTAVYIYYEEDSSTHTPYQSVELNDGTELHTYNLEKIFSIQRYVRCFDLPPEYAEDAVDKIPEEYGLDYSDEEEDNGNITIDEEENE